MCAGGITEGVSRLTIEPLICSNRCVQDVPDAILRSGHKTGEERNHGKPSTENRPKEKRHEPPD